MLPIARRTPYVDAAGIMRGMRLWRASGPGEVARALVERLSALTGTADAILAQSARAGLLALFAALPKGPRRRVVLSAYTFHFVPWVIHAAGYEPVFVDPDLATARPSADRLLAAVDDRTAAVVVTHLFGFPGEAYALRGELAHRGVLLVEDACHALGATLAGMPAGGIGDAAIVSFGVGKLLPAGTGGAVLVRDRALPIDAVRAALDSDNRGRPRRAMHGPAGLVAALALTRTLFPLTLYPFLRAGGRRASALLDEMGREPFPPPGHPDGIPGTGPMNDLAAAIVLAQIDDLPEKIAAIRRTAALLREELSGAPGVELIEPSKDSEPVPLYFRIRVPDPAGFRRRALALGLDTKKEDMSDCAVLFGAEAAKFPNAGHLVAHSVEIPSSPYLSEARVRWIAHAVKAAAR